MRPRRQDEGAAMTRTARQSGRMPARCSAARRAMPAAQRLYEAEIALHIAHQTHNDAWIAAAADKLHEAVVAYLVAGRGH
jgi:hypothetical protein